MSLYLKQGIDSVYVMVGFICRAKWRCKERKLSENKKNLKVLPTVGFEPGTSRLLSERATTELRRLMSTEWIEVHLVFTCAIFRNLPVARVRCSKIICRLFLSSNICIVLLLTN